MFVEQFALNCLIRMKFSPIWILSGIFLVAPCSSSNIDQEHRDRLASVEDGLNNLKLLVTNFQMVSNSQTDTTKELLRFFKEDVKDLKVCYSNL